jgi:hypothetical protein
MKDKIWCIQGCGINDDHTEELINGIIKAGDCFHTSMDIPPFSYNQPIDVPIHDGSVLIPYGGTQFIDAIKDDNRWCTFFNDQFTYSKAIEMLGDHMFNHDGDFMRLGDFKYSIYADYVLADCDVFIRPDKDIKEFAGTVIKPKDFHELFGKNSLYGITDDPNDTVTDNIDILVAPASRIDDEWRLWVIDGKVVSGSRYKTKGRLSINPDVPDYVVNYVEMVASIWTPAPICVMDVCSVDNDLNILEIGDFHSAGFYASDISRIVSGVNKYVDKIGLTSIHYGDMVLSETKGR